MTDISDLPVNFKTSLPPRKRAKTKEEKEQRRVERILRNRKAAHASREKKRKHVEFLESYVLDLEKQLQLVNKLNSSLLKDFYPGGNSDVDAMVNKVKALPDLKQVKLEHNLDLDDDMSPSQLPKTPESFGSASPKSSFEDNDETSNFQVPKLDSRSSSITDDSQFDFVDNSDLMDVDSSATNKFSLDIITGDLNSSNTTFVIKQEPTIQQIPTFEDPFIKKEADDILPSFEEQSNPFDFHFNTADNEFEFNELRNPEVITVTLGLSMKMIKFRCCAISIMSFFYFK